ncbi:PD-(D/E)XK nuclease family protein [Treponema pedis]|uniref:PD-(D/E)XK nuclease family protein n=1 Tax=Treponema pedis TaxID=409322 RepID=UPI00197EA562|nr:PD-(D/E)XK nuclease family protein [Treponema pedis]QSI03960.1 PD-(D/E)XK nuclease family protein [Treponema pedis]
MNLIEKTLKKYGSDLNNVFVFPSRISAMLWFQKSPAVTGLKTIPAENYISWDNFKEHNLVSDSENLTPVSNTIRSIFANYICGKNAEEAKKEKPLFSSIIPAEYAENSSVFSEWLAGVLPQLDHFEKRYINNIFKLANDSGTNDYLLLKKLYSEFLKGNKLFEPSWLSSKFFPKEKKYVIIYPELMEDFSEYADLLKSCKEISFIHCRDFNSKKNYADIYENSGSELHAAVLQIERLLSNDIPPSDIAVSVPDIENYSAYIKREFELRGIPIEFRSGFKLGSEQAGKIFSLIYNCVQNNFAFEFIKPVILNNHIPWKDKTGVQALIQYGVKNNCAVSWKESSQDISYKNIWIESFKTNYEKTEEEVFLKEKAKNWFYKFYYAAKKLCKSKTFEELQKNYFIFREDCINVSEFSEKDNAILGRCLSSLKELTSLEKKFKDYMPNDKLNFFVSQLEKEIYVPQNTGCAVSIFPYRVAAGTPFTYHFILNCSQKHTNIIYNKLSFLRKDKREELGVYETDASSYFFAAYAESENCIFSFAEQSFSGYLIINGFFDTENEETEKEKAGEKLNELLFFDSFKNEDNAEKKETVYKTQKEGAGIENLFKYTKKFSYLENEYSNRSKKLTEHIAKTKLKNNSVKVSQSDLKKFYECPVFWFLSNVLAVYPEEYDAAIFDSRDIGNLCHEVLEKLYKEIKKTDNCFNKEHIETYKSIAEKEIEQITENYADFRGALAKPFIQSLKQRILYAVEFVLKTDSELLNGYSPDWIEEWIETDCEGILYRGKIDRASFPPDERSAVIIDYKTNSMPAFSSYGNKDDDDIELTDFQIPMYIFLAETKLLQNKKQKEGNSLSEIEHAWFLSFVQQKINKVVNDNTVIEVNRKGKEKTRKEFQSVIDTFILYAEHFAECVHNENFTKTKNVTFENCSACSLKNVCRTVYSVK